MATPMTHTETQAMCEQASELWPILNAMAINYAGGHQVDHLDIKVFRDASDLFEQAVALLTRQQQEIDRLREAAKGSAVIVNVAKGEIDQRDLLLGEAKSILSLLVSDKTTSTSSQSIWAQCVSLECRIRAALQAKPETTAPISPA